MRAASPHQALSRRPAFPSRLHDLRITLPALLLGGLSLYGGLLTRWHATLYLGVLLAFICPILCLLWVMCGLHPRTWAGKAGE